MTSPIVETRPRSYRRRPLRHRILTTTSALLVAAAATLAAAQATAPTSQADAPSSQPATAPATRPAAFDPARHMRVDEIRPGMTGYGLTVLSGTTITKFPVEVVSVLHDVFGPKQSVVMIRCTDEFMRRVGPIAGCSGSPIYLDDGTGRPRLIGAYAMGYDLAKEPIIGVQPIEYMLTLDKPREDGTPSPPASASMRAPLSLLDARTQFARPLVSAPAKLGQPVLRALATPLAIRGIGARSLEGLAPSFRALGFEPLASAAPGGADAADATIEPGSVLAGAMLTGDLEMTALGTCTEVIDGRAYGFGHPFNGEGPTSVPMGAGAVNLVMPTLLSSFKMGSIGRVAGAIDVDGTYGVAGQIGAAARTFPIRVSVTDKTLGTSKSYAFQSAVHRMFSPMLAGAALQAALVADRPLPPEHTVTYEVTIAFEGGRTLVIRSIATSSDEGDAARDVAWPIQMMMNNPFDEVRVRSVDATATVESGARVIEILSAASARESYKPGETAQVRVRTRRHGDDAVATRLVDVPLPATLADGDYPITVSDAATHLAAEGQAEPYRFQVRTADELFAGLTDIARASERRAMYVRLGNLGEGVAIGRTAMAKLPPSRRALLAGAERPDTSAVNATRVVVVTGEDAVTGGTQATLKVRKRPLAPGGAAK